MSYRLAENRPHWFHFIIYFKPSEIGLYAIHRTIRWARRRSSPFQKRKLFEFRFILQIFKRAFREDRDILKT